MSEEKPRASLIRAIMLRLVVYGGVALLAAITIPYFFVAKGHSSPNACLNNLRQIDGAKQQWALENKKSEYDIPTSADLAPYIKNNRFPKCPGAGTYTIGRMNQDPTCSKSANGHVLPTP